MFYGSSSGIILYVDDQEDMGILVQTFLSTVGIRVETCRSGQNALERLKTRDVSLVVTDIHMPGMDGLTLSEKISDLYPQIPIVFVTAYAEELKGSGVPSYAILRKPLEREVFIGFIRRALRDTRYTEQLNTVRNEVQGIRLDISELTNTVQAHLNGTTQAVGNLEKSISKKVWPEIRRPFKHRAVAWLIGLLGLLLLGFMRSVAGYTEGRVVVLNRLEQEVPIVQTKVSRLEQDFQEIKSDQKAIFRGIEDIRILLRKKGSK